MLIKSFNGKAKDMWLEEISNAEECEYNADCIGDFISKRYTIYTTNGIIEVINPCMVLEPKGMYNRNECANDVHLRFVLDIDKSEVLDIPKNNILFIKTINNGILKARQYIENLNNNNDDEYNCEECKHRNR